MKTTLVPVALLATFLAGFESPARTALATQQPLELLCRGGSGAFRFEEPNLRQQMPNGQTVVELHLYFNTAGRAAGAYGQGLAPGTCSLIDRPLLASEPRRVRFETVANAQLKQAMSGTAIDRSPTAAETYPDARTIPEYLSSPDHYWVFFIERQPDAFFTASSHRHWTKPAPGSLEAERRRYREGRGEPARPIPVKEASFASSNYPDRYIRHRNALGYLDQIRDTLGTKDATFRIVPGLAGRCASFESHNYPDHFLRHEGFRIKLAPRADTPLFRQDATFCIVGGLAGADLSSFESVNLPRHYIRHRNSELWLDRFEDTNLFKQDATFKVQGPLTRPMQP